MTLVRHLTKLCILVLLCGINQYLSADPAALEVVTYDTGCGFPLSALGGLDVEAAVPLRKPEIKPFKHRSTTDSNEPIFDLQEKAATWLNRYPLLPSEQALLELAVMKLYPGTKGFGFESQAEAKQFLQNWNMDLNTFLLENGNHPSVIALINRFVVEYTNQTVGQDGYLPGATPDSFHSKPITTVGEYFGFQSRGKSHDKWPNDQKEVLSTMASGAAIKMGMTVMDYEAGEADSLDTFMSSAVPARLKFLRYRLLREAYTRHAPEVEAQVPHNDM